MTDNLKPCPFCGGEARIFALQIGKGWRVVCSKPFCAQGPNGDTEAEAIAAWNTRAERTCRMEYNEKASGDELYPTEAYTCSSCRCVTLDGKPNYCPNCGAKVVER